MRSSAGSGVGTGAGGTAVLHGVVQRVDLAKERREVDRALPLS